MGHSQQALARVAVGKGIRHNFSLPKKDSSILPSKSPVETKSNTSVSQTPVQAGLSALTSNFQNSLQKSTETSQQKTDISEQPSLTSLSYVPGSLRRDDSLVDLAMIPMVENTSSQTDANLDTGLTFIDFPWDPSILK